MATDNTPAPRAPKPAKIGRFKISLNVLVQVFIVFLILLMLNYLSFNHYKRWDFTRTHFYSLSDKSKRVLDGLKKPVKVFIFYPAASPIYSDVDNLLKEYQYSSNGKINVEIVDPNRNPTRANELANIYKFNGQDNILILDNGDRKVDPASRVKFITEREMVDLDTSGQRYGQPAQITGFKGEEAVTSALLAITDDKPNILYAVTGHHESDFTGEDFTDIKGYIEHENVKVKPLNLQNVNAVPADAAILLVLGARYDFTDREIKLLRDYWERKGRMLILLDPDSQKQTPNLMAFLDEQGVRPDDDRILRVEPAIGMLVRFVTADFIDGSPITKTLKGTNGLFQGDTQSLTLDQTKAEAAGIRLQKLAQASKGYWGETDYNIKAGDPAPYFQPNKDFGQPLVVVASVEKGALASAQVHVDSARMIVSGNCDFISKQTLTAPNLDFTINSIDWLLDRVELIGIGSKDYSVLSLNLSDSQMSRVLSTTMFLIPALVGLLGFAVWWKRRH